jgi:hypothetical protein
VGEGVTVRLRIESLTPRTSEDAATLASLLAEELDRPVDVDLVVIPVARGASQPAEDPAE